MTQSDQTARLRPGPEDAASDPQPVPVADARKANEQELAATHPPKVDETAIPAPAPSTIPSEATSAPEPRYKILGSIHRGGMGEILLAKVAGPEGFARKVVLKGLLERLTSDDVSFQLFMREACLMARLEHPNVVRVFDLPTLSGKPYLAMEYVRGRNFHQVIQRAGAMRPGMPVRVALHVVAEALRGLHSAHNARDEKGQPLGIIHRDVSPGNILVSFFGEVKVTDFGIAKVANAPKFTGPRSIRGKARYVAPEQVHGEAATVLSDVYSAGVVLAESLLGEALWERATVPETLLAIVSEDRERTIDRVLQERPQIPGLRAALRGALAMRPGDRFQSALQLAESLEAINRNLGGPMTHADTGLYLRRLFADAPDLPSDDGFGTSGVPVPELEEEEHTDPTIITLEPEWMKNEARSTASMRAHEAVKVPLTPVLDVEGAPLETRKVAPLDPSERRVSIGPLGRSPLGEAEIEAGPMDQAVRHTTRIRATPVPLESAVVATPMGSDSYPFSELIPVSTEEEESRELDRLVPPERALVPHARRAHSPAPDRSPDPSSVAMLLAGIFIGASLAIAGCVLALLLAR